MKYTVPVTCIEKSEIEYDVYVEAKNKRAALADVVNACKKGEVFFQFNITGERICETIDTFETICPNEGYGSVEKMDDKDVDELVKEHRRYTYDSIMNTLNEDMSNPFVKTVIDEINRCQTDDRMVKVLAKAVLVLAKCQDMIYEVKGMK